MLQVDRRDELIMRLANYDRDGSRRAKWAAPGRLVVRGPAGAPIAIGDKQIGVGQADVELAPGSYVLTFGDGLRATALVTRGHTTELAVAPAPQPIPDGFVYIPAGTFLFGTSADDALRKDFFDTAPLHERKTDAYAIARHEVTIADWLVYAEANPDAPVPNIPASASGAIVIERDGAAWKFASIRPFRFQIPNFSRNTIWR
jgi:formylglycine-generating enzyme required for sulfatase activity